MERLEYWKLCDEYSIMHAALIFSGYFPQDVESNMDSFNEKNFPGYVATRTALCGAIRAGKISPVYFADSINNDDEGTYIDIRRTLLSANDLFLFFKRKGYIVEHFERDANIGHISNESGPTFPLKLAAANKAWAAVTSNPSLISGKTPKQALTKWLLDNAAELGLLKKDGTPNNAGIEEVCKVANWKPEGGAPPTPIQGGVEPRQALVRVSGLKRGGASTRSSFEEIDDEIPF